jgi:hypothetical protein
MKIEIDHRRFAAQGSLSEHGPRYAKIARKRLLGEHGFPELQGVNGDLRLQAWQRGDRDNLHVLVLDQRTPVAIGLRHAGGLRELGRAREIAAGQRNHLAA